ncbi:MAG: GGDEF domain-containing protein [Lachnospiraceae bacterium]|nr:GGDEF domain-containing protein [Lachnospiraceae bacterium]
MKKRKSVLYIGFLLLAVFIGVSVFTFYKCNEIIKEGYLASEGSAAENFAVLAAANIHLTDADVERLKGYSYQEMLSSKENESLQAMMSSENFKNKVDYAYVMTLLKGDEIKYKVDSDNESLFHAALGTKLDIMWLLDVNVSENAKNSSEDGTIASDAEIRRYSYYVPKDSLVLTEAPTYLYNESEWGPHICGYCPLYSEEGHYIGVVGVELQTGDYNAYRMEVLLAMGILLGVSTATLTLLFVFLYVNYRKRQFEKIYTDALTHCYNRSYYNSQFMKRMSALRVRDYYFVLAIADIDLFKRVNDTFGHEVGDQVLIEISELLMETVGKSNVVRFGGEEFVTGLWVKEKSTLEAQLRQLFEKIAAKKFSDRSVDISISMGCCYCRGEELSGWLLSGMLKDADDNLYYAKEHGRKQFCISEFKEKE